MTHTNVTITGDTLVVEPQGLDKMWSFTRRQFWNVSDFAQTVVVQLDPAEHFTRLIISVDDPPHAVDAINAAISS
ncbi:hypothetical protein V3G39_04990 [Dermatophilaceae bacterium Sec6.4]